MRRTFFTGAATIAVAALAALALTGCGPDEPAVSAPTIAATVASADPSPPASLAASASPSASAWAASPSGVPSKSPAASPRPASPKPKPSPKGKLVVKSVQVTAAFSGSTFQVTVTVKTTGYGTASAEYFIGGVGSAGGGKRGSLTVTGTGTNTIVKRVSFAPPWCHGGATTAFFDLMDPGIWPKPGLVEKSCP